MKLTREGKGLLITGVLVAMAALNTGNNLIYLLTALMLSLGLLDVVAGYSNLKKISADVVVEEPLYAGPGQTAFYRFFNDKKHSSAFLVTLKDTDTGMFAVAPRIDPDGMTEIKGVVTFSCRGRIRLSHMKLSSGYPFGFYRNVVKLNNPKSFLVYPELIDVQGLLAGVRSIAGSGALPHPSGEDFTDIRPYQQGDPMRDIHWKSTAKTGGLMVKEFRAGISRHVTVALDTSARATPEILEKGISLAASLVEALFSEGYPVRLKTLAQVSAPARSREQLYHIMDMLALIQPEEPVPQALQEEGQEILLVVLCSRDSPFRNLAQRASGVFDAIRL
ncbi:MAG: DUF58 domain-containing protein [Acidobacteria bacterium]|nr:DUF58 domain-containing protein [Acidobacteriota bacterium]